MRLGFVCILGLLCLVTVSSAPVRDNDMDSAPIRDNDKGVVSSSSFYYKLLQQFLRRARGEILKMREGVDRASAKPVNEATPVEPPPPAIIHQTKAKSNSEKTEEPTKIESISKSKQTAKITKDSSTATKATKSPALKAPIPKTRAQVSTSKAPETKAKSPALNTKVSAPKTKISAPKTKVSALKAKVSAPKRKVFKPKTKAPAPPTKAKISKTKAAPAVAPEMVFVCKDGEYYADSIDCRKFYHCANGVRHALECQPGLCFDPTTKVCDWARNV